MRILGVNMGTSRPRASTALGLRHELSDGSAALISDCVLKLATIDERHSRRRYSGGFDAVAQHWISPPAGSDQPVFDVVAISSCCGPRWPDSNDTDAELERSLPLNTWNRDHVAGKRLVVVDHHQSHAALGFVSSGAERAIVAVIDGFGNLRDARGWKPGQWWRGKFARHSYFLAEWCDTQFKLTEIANDATGINDVGLGELYRELTHFCGWDSYQQAGSAMALAAFGDPKRLGDFQLVDHRSGEIRVHLENQHASGGSALTARLRDIGLRVPPLNGRQATTTDELHCAVAAAVQRQLTEALTARILPLAAAHRVETIVVAGGVAMNCLAMGELQRQFPGRVFVPPAPSDTGQGLGNALWALSAKDSPLGVIPPRRPRLEDAPFWGPAYSTSEIYEAVQVIPSHSRIAVLPHQSLASQTLFAARSLAAGRVVATCLGRAEYGPRALGRRSVLGDASRRDMPTRLNRFKRRESYRPFAPAILSERCDDYFSHPVLSPFMSFAVAMRKERAAEVPAAVHADGTARVQTVEAKSASPLRSILEQFYELTKIPLLLNTSFNRKGEPMVEAPRHAVAAFVDSNLDALLLDHITLVRE